MTLRPLAGRSALWWSGGALAVLLLLLAFGVGLGESSGWQMLREPLQRRLSLSAGVPVQLDGSFRARLWGEPQLSVQRLKVGAAAGVPVPHLVDAQDVQLAWRWRELWHWRQNGGALPLRSLHAHGLDARLVRLADGRASWQIGTKHLVPGEANEPLELPQIGRLTIDAGQILVDDPQDATRLQIELKGGEGAQASGYRARADGQFRHAKLRLSASAGSVLPLVQSDADGASAPAIPVRIEGDVGTAQIVFDGQASALLSAHRLDGKLRLKGPSLAAIGDPLGVTLPNTPPFDLAGQLSHDAGVWHLRADAASIGKSQLGGDFSYDTRRRPRFLSGRLTGRHLALQDLGRAIGTQGAAGESRAKAASGGRVLPQRRLDLPSLRAMDADVQVAVDEFDFGSNAIAPMRALRTHLQLAKGVLQLDDLHATVAGGTMAGSSRLDSNHEAALWSADLRFDKVDLAGWIRALQTKNAAPVQPQSAHALREERTRARQTEQQPVRSYITGVLGATVKVQGSGHSTGEILSTLGGQIHLRVREGTLSHLVTELVGLDLAQALGVAVRGDQPLPLRCGMVDLTVQQGVATARRAVLDNRDSTINITGRIDLRNEALALRATARPKDVSPLTLRAPVLVTGTLAKPVIGIEGTRVAGRLLLAAVLGAITGPAALLPLVDPGTGQTVDPCSDAALPRAAAAAPAR